MVAYSILAGIQQSDHAPFFLVLDMSNSDLAFNRCGLQLWRINLNVLKEDGVAEAIQEIWDRQAQTPQRGGVAKLLRALDETRLYLRRKGKEVAAKQKESEAQLRWCVAILQQQCEMEDSPGSDTIRELKVAKASLKKLEEYKAKGWYHRARVKWAVEGDAPGKFFFSTVKAQRKRNTIPPLPDEDGKVHSTPADLAKLVKNHFADFLKAQEQPSGWEDASTDQVQGHAN